MTDTLSVWFWSFLLRTGQAAVEASPTLLCGLVVAGVLRRMAGPEGTRRLFGGGGWRGLLRAWGIGMLLPVCALGVIPIAREMRRAGVASGTVLAFVLAAPHINPLSLLYGLTLSEPVVILCFGLGSLAVSLAAGAVWDHWLAAPGDTPPPADEPLPPHGLKRLAAVAVTAAREAVGPSAGYVLIALVGTGLLVTALPFGCLQRTMTHPDPLSPLLMAAVAIPAYAAPLPGMMVLGLMFEHGNSVGAAFVLFELGIGVNLGLLAWLGRTFGARRALAWLGLVVLVVLGLAYAAEPTLYFAEHDEGHTHAFDGFTAAFPAGAPASWGLVAPKLAERIGVLEPFGLLGVAGLVLLGLVLKLDRGGRLEAFLVRHPAPKVGPKPVWDRDIPGPVLAGLALLGLVLLSVVGTYVYYPPPDLICSEMTQVRADALVAALTGHRDEAVRQINHLDLLTRKLQVGVVLRTGRLDPAARARADDLREALERLRDGLLQDRPKEEITRGVREVEAANRECRKAFLGEGGP
jgi:uncharacterized membrane protein YraQ (UPF0718 family)